MTDYDAWCQTHGAEPTSMILAQFDRDVTNPGPVTLRMHSPETWTSVRALAQALVTLRMHPPETWASVRALDQACAAAGRRNTELEERNQALVRLLNSAIKDRDAALATACATTEQHDYHGPTETVRYPNRPDRTIQQAVPDPVHEQFHRAVGDVLAGKVMLKAREQMRDALDKAPKEKTSFPVRVTFGDRRRIGA